MRLLVFPILLASLWVPATDVIITGSGGEEAYTQRFETWSRRLEKSLVEGMGRPASGLTVFSAAPENNDSGVRETSLERLESFFRELARRHDPKSDLFIYMIGHGSYLRDSCKFQIPGPDLTARILDHWLDAIPARNIVVVNGASASAGFVNRLSGPNRIICSATKNIGEINAPEFMEFFIQSLEDESADQNRDQRISIWETGKQAAALTEGWYMSNGLLASEHAILDDNGDGLGTRLYQQQPQKNATDGKLAQACFLRGFRFPEKAPANLVEQYLSLMEQVESLTARKQSMQSGPYYKSLESKILAAARLHEKIRKYAE